MTNGRRHLRPAFTLIELILVMVIICVALARAAPSLRGWNRGTQLRNAGDDFLATARWARAQAVADAKVYRLNVDAGAGKYWVTVQQGGQFVNVANSFGQAVTLPPDELRIQLAAVQPASSAPPEFIEFYPSGRSTAARVRITLLMDGSTVDIECPTPAEGFALVNPQQGLAS
jgi:prepilin-type N-terminal cleavage/methylation domain-containing protein